MAEVGPVEYMAVAFPGNKFKGDIAPALEELVKGGTIRIIDLAFVTKDPEGTVLAMELEDVDSETGKAFQTLQAEIGQLIGEEDLENVAKALPANSSAAILVWEDLWAAKFVNAMAAAGAHLVDIRRVPYDAVQAAMEWASSQPEEAAEKS